VREYIQRMTDCGIPARAAVYIYADFRRRGRLPFLTEYIERVEAIQHGGVETVSE